MKEDKILRNKDIRNLKTVTEVLYHENLVQLKYLIQTCIATSLLCIIP